MFRWNSQYFRSYRSKCSTLIKVLQDTIEQSRAAVSKKLVEAKKTLTLDLVKESIENMRGACTIVYPMGLLPHDPIQALRVLF